MTQFYPLFPLFRSQQSFWAVLLFFLFPIHSFGQAFHCYPESMAPAELSSLRTEFGAKKEIPAHLEAQTLIALSFYPELKDVAIRFKYSDLKTTMAARPTLPSAFRDNRRVYTIYIDALCAHQHGILLDQVPFNAQIGLIGHELAHIKYYEQLNSFQVMKLAAVYLLDKQKEKYEKFTDDLTIRQGLGWQLWQWSQFVHYESNASADYRAYKAQFYLKPEEIAERIGEWELQGKKFRDSESN